MRKDSENASVQSVVMRSSVETLVGSMRILARDIESEDGVSNAAIAEAADRLERMRDALIRIMVWAEQDMMSGETRRKAMSDIIKACREGLHE